MSLREKMIADGRISVPNDTGRSYEECYWAFMARWFDKGSRRWESLRKTDGRWS